MQPMAQRSGCHNQTRPSTIGSDLEIGRYPAFSSEIWMIGFEVSAGSGMGICGSYNLWTYHCMADSFAGMVPLRRSGVLVQW